MALSPIEALRLAKHAQTRARAQLPRVVREIDDELLKMAERVAVPGIHFMTQEQGRDVPKLTEAPSVHQGAPAGAVSQTQPEPHEEDPLNYIRRVTPNQYLAYIGERGMEYDKLPYYLKPMKEAMESGEPIKLNIPMFQVPGHIPEGGGPSTHGGERFVLHDGRHRMAALRALGHGDTPVPVHVTDQVMFDWFGHGDVKYPEGTPELLDDDPNLLV